MIPPSRPWLFIHLGWLQPARSVLLRHTHIPALLDWHIQVLRDEAIDDRDRQAALLGPLQMKCDKQLEQLQQAIAEQRTEFEQRIESLSNELTASRTAATEQKSELKSLAREKTNLQTINAGLSARVDKALASLSTVQAQVSGQTVLLDAEKEKVAALQVAMTTRLDDKDQLNASLKKQVVPQSVVAMKKTKRKMR
jgi:chromosome segregation ATPase